MAPRAGKWFGAVMEAQVLMCDEEVGVFPGHGNGPGDLYSEKSLQLRMVIVPQCLN